MCYTKCVAQETDKVVEERAQVHTLCFEWEWPVATASKEAELG